MNWDWVIGLTIILGLVLAIWARVSGMTIPDLLRGLTEYVRDTREGVQENAFIPYYE